MHGSFDVSPISYFRSLHRESRENEASLVFPVLAEEEIKLNLSRHEKKYDEALKKGLFPLKGSESPLSMFAQLLTKIIRSKNCRDEKD